MTVKKHIKMYGDDEFLKDVKDIAEKEGLSQTTFIFMAIKKIVKQYKKECKQ